MNLLSIGFSGPIDEIRIRLQHGFSALALEGFQMVIDEYNKGHITFFGCRLTEGKLSFQHYERVKAMVKNYIAKMVADVIVCECEQDVVRKIINRNYCYFSEEERNTVFENTFKILNIDNLPPLGAANSAGRHSHILGEVSAYLDIHHELVLDGFINFRLKEYRQELIDAVDKAVDDFMMDREYKEFIRLLRYFVDVQEPRVDVVHVVLQTNGVFRLLDSCGKVVNNQHLEGFVVKNAENELNYDDLLISALITIAPQNVTIHGSNVQQCCSVIDTINSVFDGRVCICEGCEICKAEGKTSTIKQ